MINQNILSRGDGNISMESAQELVSNLGKKAKFDASRSTESNDLAKQFITQSGTQLMNLLKKVPTL